MLDSVTHELRVLCLKLCDLILHLKLLWSLVLIGFLDLLSMSFVSNRQLFGQAISFSLQQFYLFTFIFDLIF